MARGLSKQPTGPLERSGTPRETGAAGPSRHPPAPPSPFVPYADGRAHAPNPTRPRLAIGGRGAYGGPLGPPYRRRRRRVRRARRRGAAARAAGSPPAGATGCRPGTASQGRRRPVRLGGLPSCPSSPSFPPAEQWEWRGPPPHHLPSASPPLCAIPQGFHGERNPPAATSAPRPRPTDDPDRMGTKVAFKVTSQSPGRTSTTTPPSCAPHNHHRGAHPIGGSTGARGGRSGARIPSTTRTESPWRPRWCGRVGPTPRRLPRPAHSRAAAIPCVPPPTPDGIPPPRRAAASVGPVWPSD